MKQIAAEQKITHRSTFSVCTLCWNFRTIYGGQEPSRNRVVVPARQVTQAGETDSLESVSGLIKSLNIPLLSFMQSRPVGFPHLRIHKNAYRNPVSKVYILVDFFKQLKKVYSFFFISKQESYSKILKSISAHTKALI